METVVNQNVGYSFTINIETEKREGNGTKYPDKTVVSARLSGHEESYEKVVERLAEAKKKVKEILEEASS